MRQQPNSTLGRRIVIAVEAYFPDEAGTPFLITQLARSMARRGCAVTVITSTPGEIVDEGGIKVVRTGPERQATSRLVARGLRMLRSAWSLAWHTRLRSAEADAVFVVVGPTLLPAFVTIGLLASRRCPPVIPIVHDLYPDAAVSAGAISPGSLVARLWRLATHLVLARARRVVVLGDDMRVRVEESYPAARNKIAVVPHWSVGDTVRRISRESSTEYKAHGLSGYFVLQYAGNIGLTHGVGTMLEGAALLASGAERNEVRFVFFGSGAASELVRKAETTRDSVVRYLGTRPRSAQTDFLACCDVTVIGYAPGMMGVSVPSRLPGVLAAGRPIIALADDESDLARLVRSRELGWVVKPGDAAGFVEAVREAKRNRDALAAMGDRVEREASHLSSLDSAADAYLSEAGIV